MWDLPGPGLEPVSPALASGFLSTVPPGKPCSWLLSNTGLNCMSSLIRGYLSIVNIGLAKKFFWFLSKNKRQFSFSPRTLLNNVFTVLFYYLLPFFRQLHNSIFPKLLIFFWAKNYSRCLLQSSRELKFFSLREFVKTKINGHWKVQCLVNMMDESELPSQIVTVFAWSSKKHAVLCYPAGRLCIFCWLILDTSSSATFGCSNWEQCLLELIVWFSQRSS